MKHILCASAAFALLAGAGAAHAQTGDWTGPYVGAHAGVAVHRDSDGETIGFDTNLDGAGGDTVRTAAGANAFSPGFCGGASVSSIPGSCPEDESALEYGVRAGYDWQFGAYVAGVVAEASGYDLKDAVSAYSTTPAFYTMQRELESMIALRARGGYAFGDNLIYATGGVAQGRLDHTFSTSNTANTFTQTSDDRATGYQIGGGLEHRLTPNITLGAEYLFTSLKDDDHVVRAQGPAPATNPFILANSAGTDFRRSEEDFRVHSFRVTMGYRF